MLDIKFIRDNQEIVKNAIKNKKGEDVDLEVLLTLYDKRLNLIKDIDEINREKNEAAREQNIEKGTLVKENLKIKEEELNGVNKEFAKLMAALPNIPSADTPVGETEEDNKILRTCLEKKKFDFEPKPHWVLGEELDLIDMERAAKTVGSRFSYLKGDLVLLQFALVQYCFYVLTSKDIIKKIIADKKLAVSDKTFLPIIPPAFVKPEILFGMGRLDPKDDKFFLEKDNLFLAGSAEHLLGSMFAKEKLKESDLPLRLIGYSTAFRREAGSYGKDTKGILRQHQFDKLEMQSFSSPESSVEEQEFLVSVQEYMMNELEIPYQVVIVCTGDMGRPDHRQIDIEAWMPGQDKYRETHSSDYNGSFQSRRLDIRIDRESRDYVHTNDATAIAVGRMLIAIMENYQNEDGTITVPEVLRKYMNKDRIWKGGEER